MSLQSKKNNMKYNNRINTHKQELHYNQRLHYKSTSQGQELVLWVSKNVVINVKSKRGQWSNYNQLFLFVIQYAKFVKHNATQIPIFNPKGIHGQIILNYSTCNIICKICKTTASQIPLFNLKGHNDPILTNI